MERTIPQTVSNQIGLYVRTYYSLLRSTSDIAIETLHEAHESMGSLLHLRADSHEVDVSALIYASLRLPPEIRCTRLVLLGQRTSVFERHGFHVEEWHQTGAKARRRRAYFDGEETLALYIASRSDIDDVIPTLSAYQIEWNKLNLLLSETRARAFVESLSSEGWLTSDEMARLAQITTLDVADVERLFAAWGHQAIPLLQSMSRSRKGMHLNLLAGSLADYRKAMLKWWRNIEECAPEADFRHRRVYFVSSNLHSLVNLWTGYALRKRFDLIHMLDEPQHSGLKQEGDALTRDSREVIPENYLYYLLKTYQEEHGRAEQIADEESIGICRINSSHGFDLGAQIIPLYDIKPDWLDPRLQMDGAELLKQSDALIVNIDYPLGMAAYDVMSRISENVNWISGVYIMGKAATLNGRIGDVMIPTVVHDEHSANTYLFQNCFSAADVSPYLVYGNVLDVQKSVTVLGTFLQNADYMSVFYREGYTDIEMEAGPYLSAIYELVRPKRHPQNEIVSLYGHPLDLGIIHYASDTPLTKGGNLGAGSLSYRGIDPTYAAAVAILRRIISQEIKHVKAQQQ